MLLGEFECDYETAYFLENGTLPPLKPRCPRGEVDIRTAIEREWRKPDMQYIMWQGCRLGSQFDWLS